MRIKLSNSQFEQLIAITLILGLLSVLLYNVIVYHAEVPVWDQWVFAEILEKHYTNQLSFEDFWAQHNEHRLIFPRIIFLAMALLSNWTILYEKLFNIALAIGILISFIVLCRRTLPAHSAWIIPWLAVALASLIFSLRQVDNWAWGWQIAIYLNVLCVCWAILFLTSRPLNIKHVVGALCLTFIASYSFANGLLFWGIGFLLLCFSNQSLEQRLTYLTIWSLGAAGTVFSYLYGHMHPYMFPFWTDPLPLLHYILTYLGSIFSGWSNDSNLQIATTIGSIGIVFFITGLITAWRMRLEFNKLQPIIALTLYTIGTAASSGVGRLQQGGVTQALSSRYTSFGLLFWCATGILLCYVLLARQKRRQQKAPLMISGALLLFVFVMANIASVASQHHFMTTYMQRSTAIHTLKNSDFNTPKSYNEAMKVLIWDPDLGRRYAIILKRHNLSLFQ